jgi:hypothetical protein
MFHKLLHLLKSKTCYKHIMYLYILLCGFHNNTFRFCSLCSLFLINNDFFGGKICIGFCGILGCIPPIANQCAVNVGPIGTLGSGVCRHSLISISWSSKKYKSLVCATRRNPSACFWSTTVPLHRNPYRGCDSYLFILAADAIVANVFSHLCSHINLLVTHYPIKKYGFQSITISHLIFYVEYNHFEFIKMQLFKL